jgi:hypothetical protein
MISVMFLNCCDKKWGWIHYYTFNINLQRSKEKNHYTKYMSCPIHIKCYACHKISHVSGHMVTIYCDKGHNLICHSGWQHLCRCKFIWQPYSYNQSSILDRVHNYTFQTLTLVKLFTLLTNYYFILLRIYALNPYSLMWRGKLHQWWCSYWQGLPCWADQTRGIILN